jgi:transketolase
MNDKFLYPYNNTPALDSRSKYLRKLVVEAIDGGGRGHLGSSMSLIEILRVLYDDVLKYKSDEPTLFNRDRFVLSKGHGCLAQYALLSDKGFFSRKQLKLFCHSESFLGGHPERGKVPGVEASTGALGHGLPIGVGMALSLKIRKIDSKVYIVCGDGEINEGSVWEAALSAAKHKLDNLVLIIDYNKLQSYGDTRDVLPLEPLRDKLESFGFSTKEVDGHNISQLKDTFINIPFIQNKPNALICHTIKGKGFYFAEQNPEWHHKSRLSKDEIDLMYNLTEV